MAFKRCFVLLIVGSLAALLTCSGQMICKPSSPPSLTLSLLPRARLCTSPRVMSSPIVPWSPILMALPLTWPLHNTFTTWPCAPLHMSHCMVMNVEHPLLEDGEIAYLLKSTSSPSALTVMLQMPIHSSSPFLSPAMGCWASGDIAAIAHEGAHSIICALDLHSQLVQLLVQLLICHPWRLKSACSY